MHHYCTLTAIQHPFFALIVHNYSSNNTFKLHHFLNKTTVYSLTRYCYHDTQLRKCRVLPFISSSQLVCVLSERYRFASSLSVHVILQTQVTYDKICEHTLMPPTKVTVGNTLSLGFECSCYDMIYLFTATGFTPGGRGQQLGLQGFRCNEARQNQCFRNNMYLLAYLIIYLITYLLTHSLTHSLTLSMGQSPFQKLTDSQLVKMANFLTHNYIQH